jgi:hypothetical protein
VGTYLIQYAVDLGKLTAAWGSNSKSIANKAIAGADVANNTSWFAKQIAAGAPTLDVAITEVVAGKVTRKKHAFQYVYAVEALCRSLGTAVGDELKVGEWIEELIDPLLEQVKSRDFCTIMALHKPKLPLPIPKPTEVPFVTQLTAVEVMPVLGAFSRIEARVKAEPVDEDVREDFDYVMLEIKERLRGATKRRRGLVSFLY